MPKLDQLIIKNLSLNIQILYEKYHTLQFVSYHYDLKVCSKILMKIHIIRISKKSHKLKHIIILK